MFSPVVPRMFLKKRDNRRQFQWQTVLKKIKKIQQLILAINNGEFSPTTGGTREPSLIRTPPESSPPTPSDSGINDEFFPMTINDAIGTVYAEDERTQEIFNVLNTNQRTFEKKKNQKRASRMDGCSSKINCSYPTLVNLNSVS